MLIRKLNRFTGQTNEMELDVTPEQIAAFEAGGFVQNVFSNLNASEREFILTGMTLAEQKELFGK